ncbi:MAG: trigger factor [Oscillospiraceae bacterium]|nr:trigger factor [Oscillospiraceae bacterium]
MSLKSATNVSVNTHELLMEIDAEAFNAAIAKAYQKEKNQIQVKGFRKGKAPQKVIEKYYGEDVFFESAINSLVAPEVTAALEETKLDIVDRPEIQVVSATKEDGVVMKAICITRPEVNVPQYKGLKAPKVVDAVTDEVIDEQIEAARKRQARIVTVEDRAAQMDDEVTIDFEGFKDGVAFEGGKGDNFPLTLGSHQFIPGFEEQIVDHKTGDEFEINVTFPEDYQMADLAGQATTFKIKIQEIKTKELPDFDDEFVKDVSEFETVDEYKADLKAKLEESAQKKADSQFENYLFETIIKDLEGEIPQCMFDQKVEREIQEFEQRLSGNKMTLDLYFQYTGMDMDDLKASYMDRAKNEVKLRLALEKIVETENIEVTDEEVDNGLASLAAANNLKVEDVKRLISLDVYKMDLKVGKAADIVKETAEVDNTLAEKKEEEAPQTAEEE